MNSTLAKSLQIKGPSQKILGKRKQTEEEKSSSESEPEMESESQLESDSESETASDSNSEKTISEDENTKRRTKKRHEAIIVAPLQPPQHAEADANPAAAIDKNVGIIERRTKKRHQAINVAQLQPSQHGEADANPGAEIDALADPSSQVNVNLSEKNPEESVTHAEEEVPEQELTLRDLLEIQKVTAEDDATSIKTTIEKPLIVQQCLESASVQKQPVIVLALEKPGDKESVLVPREPEMAELTERDLVDSNEYLHFTPPSFDLLSQDQSQQQEIHAEQRKAVGPIKEPSSQEFGEEIIYTQGTLDRLDKEMNDMQMKIAEKKLKRILKLREELRELETPQKPETSRTRIYNWATQCKNNNQYEFLFNFKTGKAY
ncbi:hypothetical protein PIB30_083199 [Stylosanthes scabra]|uniref:Uncharacterized protein n=1 Tax=Stylosanthes scabra TaxID=79078 RepID=A0ABU6STK4_9FABA|nr:hypothetical protein [Stylosanthes scabra]